MMIKKLLCIAMSVLLVPALFACYPALPVSGGDRPGETGGPSDSGTETKAPLDGADGRITVLLDAGHGFGDVGCTSPYLKGLYEKEITLKYIEELRGKLEKKGIEVLLTHDGESYMHESELIRRADEYGVEYKSEHITDNGVFDAYERAIYTNVLLKEREIDYFLSLHVNALENSNTHEGFEIDYCAENDFSKLSKRFFDSLCRALEESFPETPRREFADKWEESFIVTKYTRLPSALLEIGYATTPADAERILDSRWQSSLTDAVSEGIAACFGK